MSAASCVVSSAWTGMMLTALPPPISVSTSINKRSAETGTRTGCGAPLSSKISICWVSARVCRQADRAQPGPTAFPRERDFLGRLQRMRVRVHAGHRTVHAGHQTIHAAFQAVEAPFRTSTAGFGSPGPCFRTSLARFRAGIVKPVTEEVGRGAPRRVMQRAVRKPAS